MANRKLLLVSYQFPPVGGIPVQRALSLARYLPEEGWTIHVLTAANPSVPTLDPGLLSRVPKTVRITRTFTPEIPYRWKQAIWKMLGGSKKAQQQVATPEAKSHPTTSGVMGRLRGLFNPDPEVVWVPFAIRAARRIMRREEIGTVLVTAPPFSSFLVGLALKREFPHLRLVADFRDEWLDFYLSAFDFYRNNEAIRRRSAGIERAVVEQSSLVLAVTLTTRDTLRSRYPEIPAGRFHTLPNGYDPAAFEQFQHRPHGSQRVVVAHVGTVYGTASPRFYLDGLDRLRPESAQRIETRFIGRITPQEAPLLEGRGSTIVQTGFLPQAEALRQMEAADFLLITMTHAPSMPGKLYEYLASGKPILAIARSGGELARILDETGAGWWADPDEPGAVERLLERAILANDGKTPFPVRREEAVRRYERPRLAKELSRILEEQP